jgi:hypothetical protein
VHRCDFTSKWAWLLKVDRNNFLVTNSARFSLGEPFAPLTYAHPSQFLSESALPLLITFRGRPVKRRRRATADLTLTFVDPVPGQTGEHLVVTQAEWEQDGSVKFFPRDEMPDVRTMARLQQSLKP